MSGERRQIPSVRSTRGGRAAGAACRNWRSGENIETKKTRRVNLIRWSTGRRRCVAGMKNPNLDEGMGYEGLPWMGEAWATDAETASTLGTDQEAKGERGTAAEESDAEAEAQVRERNDTGTFETRSVVAMRTGAGKIAESSRSTEIGAVMITGEDEAVMLPHETATWLPVGDFAHPVGRSPVVLGSFAPHLPGRKTNWMERATAAEVIAADNGAGTSSPGRSK